MHHASGFAAFRFFAELHMVVATFCVSLLAVVVAASTSVAALVATSVVVVAVVVSVSTSRL